MWNSDLLLKSVYTDGEEEDIITTPEVDSDSKYTMTTTETSDGEYITSESSGDEEDDLVNEFPIIEHSTIENFSIHLLFGCLLIYMVLCLLLLVVYIILYLVLSPENGIQYPIKTPHGRNFVGPFPLDFFNGTVTLFCTNKRIYSFTSYFINFTTMN